MTLKKKLRNAGIVGVTLASLVGSVALGGCNVKEKPSTQTGQISRTESDQDYVSRILISVRKESPIKEKYIAEMYKGFLSMNKKDREEKLKLYNEHGEAISNSLGGISEIHRRLPWTAYAKNFKELRNIDKFATIESLKNINFVYPQYSGR